VTLEATAAGSMRAIVQDGYGSTDVLRLARMARPEIADSEVLLRVHAAGLDRGAWHLMTGRPYLLRLVCGLRRPRQPVAGLDVAGTVVAVGPGVTRFCAGDEVFGFGRAPSLSTPRPAKTGLPACRATSPSSRPR
jgi:NADPH:quinone reductase-like Zn-dependent oxidoreductase